MKLQVGGIPDLGIKMHCLGVLLTTPLIFKCFWFWNIVIILCTLSTLYLYKKLLQFEQCAPELLTCEVLHVTGSVLSSVETLGNSC